MQDETADGRLDVPARAAETVVKIEMAEGRVHVVVPEPIDHLAADPNAFRVASWTVQHALGFGIFINRGAVRSRRRLLIRSLGRRGILGGRRRERQKHGCGKEPHQRRYGTQSAGKAEHSMGHGSLVKLGFKFWAG